MEKQVVPSEAEERQFYYFDKVSREILATKNAIRNSEGSVKRVHETILSGQFRSLEDYINYEILEL